MEGLLYLVERVYVVPLDSLGLKNICMFAITREALEWRGRLQCMLRLLS